MHETESQKKWKICKETISKSKKNLEMTPVPKGGPTLPNSK